MKGRIKAGEGQLIGAAGEHYVMAELLKRGIIAGLTPRNAPTYDILATKEDKIARIRVKTKSEDYEEWQWMINKKGDIFRNLSKKDDYTVLVNLTEDTEDIVYYVLPTYVLNKWLIKLFRNWLDKPGIKAPHNPDNPKRNLSENHTGIRKYLDKWELLF